MEPVRFCRAFPLALILASLASPPAAIAQAVPGARGIFPLKDVRAGQHGTGRTVFQGGRIEEFQVEVLGVLENLGPKQNVIIARLSGGPLAKTGVIQGMSGSPVYIDGRLAGAVAMGFSFATEPIAGIRPIEDMFAVNPPLPKASRAPVHTASAFSVPPLPAEPALPNAGGLVDIATPVSFSGFTRGTLDHFAPDLRKAGLQPVQGVSSGGHLPNAMVNPELLHPGDIITVQLLSGDMSIGADGTVTTIEGKNVYAFGHRFLAVGNTDLPFARADVITVLPDLASSFKISTAKEWMGAITQDRSTSVVGVLGRRASTVPLSIAVRGARHAPADYEMRMVNDRALSPLIVQMAVFSAIDATERAAGISSYAIQGRIDFNKGVPPVILDNTYAADANAPALAALGVAAPLAYAMAAGFTDLKVQDISLNIHAAESKRVLQVDDVTARRDVRPGDALDLHVSFTGENGAVIERTVRWQVPVGIEAGQLQISVSDAYTANLAELQRLSVVPKSPQQVTANINSLRTNTGAYVRIWRNETAYQSQGMDLPDPPPSVALVFAKGQGASAMNLYSPGSTVAEMRLDMGDAVVSGSKSTQVEVAP